MSGLYQALSEVLQLPSVILDGNDYTPLILALCSALVCCIVVLNIFALIRALFK